MSNQCGPFTRATETTWQGPLARAEPREGDVTETVAVLDAPVRSAGDRSAQRAYVHAPPGLLTLPRSPKALILFIRSRATDEAQRAIDLALSNRLTQAGYATMHLAFSTTSSGRSGTDNSGGRSLSDRLESVIDWVKRDRDTQHLSLGLLAFDDAVPAVLVAAASAPADVSAVVTHGGRPDHAGAALGMVTTPTLMIVDRMNLEAVKLAEGALDRLAGARHLVLAPSDEEVGLVDTIFDYVRQWSDVYLTNRFV
jgi:hypothetical protein